jgi:Flp pilus assembly protein TadD
MSLSVSRASKPVLFAAAVAILVLVPSRSFGQMTVLRGLVQDESKEPLANVKIILLDPERGTGFETRSNKKGEFMQVGIPVAAYRATFELEGYIPHETAIVLEPGTEKRAVIVMKKIPLRIDEDPDFTAGIERFQAGRYEEAVGLFLKVRERFPENVEAYFNIGVAYLRFGRANEAVEALEKAVQLKADAAEPHLALGECFVLLGRTAEAEEAFRRAVALDPGNPAALLDLGILYYKADKIDEALGCFEKAIELDPKLPAARYQAGLACVRKGDPRKAIGHFEAFLGLAPDRPEAAQVRAMVDELKKKN